MKAFLVTFIESPTQGGIPRFPVLALDAEDAQEKIIDWLDARGIPAPAIESVTRISTI